MRQALMTVTTTLMFACSHTPAGSSSPATGGSGDAARPGRLDYPVARRVEVTDEYHGHKVEDPYRWLEDVDSDETRAWVKAQNTVTERYLSSIPVRGRMRERLSELWNYERFSIPEKEGGRYFFERNDGLQNQAVVYVADSLDGEPRVLLDPNALAADGTVAIGTTAISRDGKSFAYTLSTAGSDWSEIRVRDVSSGTDTPDVLKWVKFSGIAWSPDHLGFYYSRYDAPAPGAELTGTNYHQKLYYHRLGTPQDADVLVFHRPDEKEWGFSPTVTEDGHTLVITVSKGTDSRFQVFTQDLRKKAAPVTPLITGFDAEYAFIGNVGPVFYFRSDRDAPRGRVIQIDTRRPERSRWSVVVRESPGQTLVSASLVGGHLIAEYLDDAKSHVRIHALDGKVVRELSLPGLGTVAGLHGKAKDPETFYSFTSFTTPTTVYRYDVKSGETSVFRAPKIAASLDGILTEQVFFESKDGTRVPMFVTRRRDVALDGQAPAVLYGYGGFSISLTPAFSVPALAWVERGGIYAVANLRGGGEYGEEWHKAGTKARKQNVFDDFIAAAEWLIDQRYTQASKLSIQGRSNGGLLVGAVVNQRPELFGAAVAGVGVMDMLRFHKFTIGWAWTDDYGSSDDPEMFQALRAYSPYHNIKPGTRYPAVLVTTADHDDRVVPGHSFKYTAALQRAQAGEAPVLIRVDVRAGHGAGTPMTKLIEREADVLSFLWHTLAGAPAGGALALER